MAAATPMPAPRSAVAPVATPVASPVASMLPALLDELDSLLTRQSEAIRRGDGDTLAELANLLTARLGRLSAWQSHSPMSSDARLRLAGLRSRARANQESLALRLADVQRSLDALGLGGAGGSGGAGRSGRLYAVAGGLERLSGRSGGLLRA